MKKVTQGNRVYYLSEKRLFLNRERTKLVGESSQEAHELYATPVTLIPEEAAEQFGLLKKKPKAPAKAKAKSKSPSEDKQLKGPGRQGCSGAEDQQDQVSQLSHAASQCAAKVERAPPSKRGSRKATIKAINRTMADCVLYFKGNHPGWNNISGTAEGSVRITQFAEQRSKKEDLWTMGVCGRELHAVSGDESRLRSQANR